MGRIRWKQPTASGRRTGWARTVDGVNYDVRGAKSFEGEYLRDGEEVDLPNGAIVVEVSPQGSIKNGWQAATAYVVDGEELVPRIEDEHDWRKDFLSFRDAVVALGESITGPSELDGPTLTAVVSDADPRELLIDLVDELRPLAVHVRVSAEVAEEWRDHLDATIAEARQRQARESA